MKRLRIMLCVCAALFLALPLRAFAEVSAAQATANLSSANLYIPSAGRNYNAKRQIFVEMTRLMMEKGYEPAFAAGMLANIAAEGNVGQFESICSYTVERLRQIYPNMKTVQPGSGAHGNYIAHIRGFTDYDDCGHDHSEYAAYSGGYLYNGCSLSAVGDMLSRYKAESWHAKFGLGFMQWTADRAMTLFGFYLRQAGSLDSITYNQCCAAEAEMAFSELSGAYAYVYSGWKSANADSLYSAEAARDAGSRICLHYQRPANTSASVTRGEFARDLFAIMTAGDAQEPPADTQKPVVSEITVSNVTRDGYTLSCKITDDTGVERVEFPTWSAPGGQDDLTYPAPTRSGDLWSCTVSVADGHGSQRDCYYYTGIRAYDAAGNCAAAADTPVFVDGTPPIISGLAITNLTERGFTVSCTIVDNLAVANVSFEAWDSNGSQKNLLVKTPSVKGNTWTCEVQILGPAAQFIAQVTASDAAGNRVSVATNTPAAPKDDEAPVLGEIRIGDLSGAGYTVFCSAADNQGVARVEVATWNAPGGQDDLTLHPAVRSGDEWCCKIDVKQGHLGRTDCLYYSQVRAYDAAGNVACSLPMPVYVDATPPVVTSVAASDVTADGFTVRLTATDAVGATKAQFSVYAEKSDGSRGDMRLYEAQVSGGSALARVHTADHGGETGCVYRIVAYAWDACGNRSKAAQTTVDVPARYDPTLYRPFALPKGCRVVEEGAFEGTNIELVILPEGCERIESRAFADCPKLRYVVFQSRTVDIATDAFAGSEPELIYP